MQLRSLAFRTLAIPFVASFRHAAAERAATSSVWITAITEEGVTGCGESCPRPYVTQESLASAEAFFRRWQGELTRGIDTLTALQRWVAAHESDIDRNPAAWCAIELALLDALGRTSGRPIEAVLALRPLAGTFHYTAVLGDADLATFTRTAERYRDLGFRDYKLKLSGRLDDDRSRLETLAAVARGADAEADADAGGVRVRVDANNLWPDARTVIDFLTALGPAFAPVFAVEEPVGAGRVHDLARIAAALDVTIVLDESLSRRSELAALPPPQTTWIVNLRVSKMGGLLRSLALVEAARSVGVRLIVGAQVGETSLLTRAGLTVAHATGPGLVAQEGAFGTLLLQRDVCVPALMFGAGGRLAVADHPLLVAPGLGVTDGAPDGLADGA